MSGIELIKEIEGCPENLEENLSRVLECCRNAEGVGDIGCCVRIVSDEAIKEINRDYRNIDSATDVLSFPAVSYPDGKTARDCPKLLKREYDPEMRCSVIGDVVISLDRARAQSLEFGHSLMREMCYLMAHSVFHLFGYDHMNDLDKRSMRLMEEKAMEMAGLPRKDD